MGGGNIPNYDPLTKLPQKRPTASTRRSVMKSVGVVVVGLGGSARSVAAQDSSAGELLWAFETGDSVQSSPTVLDGTVYVGSFDGNVYALDDSTGSEDWTFETGGWIWSSPAVVDETVFIGSLDNSIYALDSRTGEVHWHSKLAVGSPPRHQ